MQNSSKMSKNQVYHVSYYANRIDASHEEIGNHGNCLFAGQSAQENLLKNISGLIWVFWTVFDSFHCLLDVLNGRPVIIFSVMFLNSRIPEKNFLLNQTIESQL